MIETWPLYAILVLILACGFYLQRIDRRVRLMSARLGRLSLTFQKIENDLDALQSSVLILAKNDPEMLEEIALIRDRRQLIFRHIVENGPNSMEILRGLEWPDFEDDPVFWKDGSLADRMRLPKTLNEVRNTKVEE